MTLVTTTTFVSTSALHDPNYLAHHGIKGQKWGVRRFQNEDGSLKSAGMARYLAGAGHRAMAKVYSVNEKYYSKRGNKLMASMNKSAKEQALAKAKRADPGYDARRNKKSLSPEDKKARTKKILKTGAIAAGAALEAYGGYKLYQKSQDKKAAAAMAQRMMLGEQQFSRSLAAFK